KGFREVRIIHGRGIGVQREIVRGILMKHPDVHSFHDAPDRGSTTVRMRIGN
ncbi:MAG TPA: Smr/MutS family protein, partial [Terriglobia bacterium]|nr:Smr/MutS family protein [Terriglobia bacterium]